MRASSQQITRIRLAARRHLDAEQLLHGQREADVGRQRAEVVHAVRVGDELQVGAVLGDLLHSAVQIAQMRDALDDALAVELEHQPQHAVGRRVRRPHVDRHDVRVVGMAFEGRSSIDRLPAQPR